MRADQTVAVKKETKERLLLLKKYDRETFDDIINRLLDEYDKKFEQSKLN